MTENLGNITELSREVEEIVRKANVKERVQHKTRITRLFYFFPENCTYYNVKHSPKCDHGLTQMFLSRY